MTYPTKIATCCHCGTRAVLTLGRDRHELACASCGAPLHDLKSLPVRPDPKPAVTHQPTLRSFSARPSKRKLPKPKRRKSFMRLLAKEAFDLIDDVFD